MGKCYYCDTNRLFGGIKDKEKGLFFCNDECEVAGRAILQSHDFPKEMVAAQIKAAFEGRCPRCNGRGPVDVRTSHQVASFLIFSTWKSMPEICCRGCGLKKNGHGLLYSFLLGWWAIPWGLIMTPIQILKNMAGLITPMPKIPSKAFERLVRVEIGVDGLDPVDVLETLVDDAPKQAVRENKQAAIPRFVPLSVPEGTREELKRRMNEYLNSEAFDAVYKELHLSKLALWTTWAISPFLLKSELSKAAEKRIRGGDSRSWRLRKRYRKLAEKGQFVMACPVIANSLLGEAPDMNLPALIAATFGGSEDERLLFEKRHRLADIAIGKGSDLTKEENRLAKSLADQDYTFRRRRPLPASMASIPGSAKAYAMDLMLVGKFLTEHPLFPLAIPCLAETGKKGLTCMIPGVLMKDLIAPVSQEALSFE